MREKKDKSKLMEKRGVISTEMYCAWKTACETKSWGKASMIYDPVVGRTVHTMSQAETKVFWRLRFLPDVIEVYEQFPLNKDEVSAICSYLDIHPYSRILSTDFLVKMKNDRYVAISVKDSRNTYDPQKNPRFEKDLNRLKVDKIYWENNYGIPVKALFGDEMNDIFVNNIKNIMHFWDSRFITNKVSMLKFLLAHNVIDVPMEHEYIRFGDLAENYDVEALYEAYIKNTV